MSHEVDLRGLEQYDLYQADSLFVTLGFTVCEYKYTSVTLSLRARNNLSIYSLKSFRLIRTSRFSTNSA